MSLKNMKLAITQQQVDKEIERLIHLAIRKEDMRDKQVYESPSYWKFHDQAIRYHLWADSLMTGEFWRKRKNGTKKAD